MVWEREYHHNTVARSSYYDTVSHGQTPFRMEGRGLDMAIKQFVNCTMECVPITAQYSIT